MSDPHIPTGGSSDDSKKDNIPSTSSNSLLGALSLPADHTFGHVSESSDCEKEEEELGLKDTSAKDNVSSRPGETLKGIGKSLKQKYKPGNFRSNMDNVSIISASGANSLSVDELTAQISTIVEQIKHLKTREKDINESSEVIDIVEKRLLLRKIKINSRALNSNLKELSAAKVLKELNADGSDEEDESEDDEDNDDDSGERPKETREEKIGKDNQTLQDAKKTEYNRLVNLCIRTKEEIKRRKKEVTELLSQETTFLTDSETRERDIKIKMNLKTVDERVNMYKNYNSELTKICSHDDIETLMKNLNDVLDDSNYLNCLFESISDRQKKIEANSSPASLQNVTIERFDGTGIDRFLKYRSFMAEYNEFVLAKPVPDLIKLRWLKKSLDGEALKLVKSYTLGSQLQTALEALEGVYNKQDLIIAEIYRSFKQLPRVGSFQGDNLNKAKSQVNILKVGLATLSSMGLGDELRHDSPLQTTFLLTELEAKIPISTHLRWIEEKDRLQKQRINPNIEHFTEFYEKAVETNSDAVYMRNRLDEISGPQREKEKGKGVPVKGAKSDGKRKPSNLLRTEGKEVVNTGSEQEDSKREASEAPMKGNNKNQFCLWDNCYGHSSFRSLNTKLDHAYKLRALA